MSVVEAPVRVIDKRAPGGLARVRAYFPDATLALPQIVQRPCRLGPGRTQTPDPVSQGRERGVAGSHRRAGPGDPPRAIPARPAGQAARCGRQGPHDHRQAGHAHEMDKASDKEHEPWPTTRKPGQPHT